MCHNVFLVIHIVKCFGVVKKAEVDVFLELFCFFDDPVGVSNSIYGSTAFSKSSLNIWKFIFHTLLKPGLENFEHYFASTSLVAQMVKPLPTMWETQVQSLGREDLLEKEMATYSSILAWNIPWMEEPGRLQSMGWQRVGHD